MDTTKVAEWLERVDQAKNEGLDLIDLGVQLANESQLAPEAYQELLRALAVKLWANDYVNLLERSIASHPIPREPFWSKLILAAKDDELGMKLLATLMPYLNLTELVCGLLETSRNANPDGLRRIRNTVWGAACGASLALSTRDCFYMREALDRKRVLNSLLDALRHFSNPSDREALTDAKRALE